MPRRRGFPRPDRAGWTHRTNVWRTVLIRYVVVLGLGYVLGAKAGRRGCERFVGPSRALTSSPAAKSVIEGGRRKIANRVSPDARMVTLTEIDDATIVVEREEPN